MWSVLPPIFVFWNLSEHVAAMLPMFWSSRILILVHQVWVPIPHLVCGAANPAAIFLVS